MKKLLILFIFIFSLNAFGQNDPKVPAVVHPVGIEEIYLTKDDGSGKAGDVAENFQTNDIPIHCIIQLDSMNPTTVKMNFVAVNVKGVKAESKVITVNYKTNGKQNRVDFTGKPEKNWTAGTYRIDVFLDDKLTQSKTFEIKDAEVLPVAANSFQAVKPAPAKPKPVKRPRKN